MDTESEIERLLPSSIERLLDYCRRNKWAGADPFDGLNSLVFSALPLARSRIIRLMFIQAMKQSPFNLRRILLVPASENPKGLAVFCSAVVILSKVGPIIADDTIRYLLGRLKDLKSKDRPFFCWGYNFDWQSRSFFLPKFVPNIICTTFAGNALIDAYEKFSDVQYLDMAVSAGHFLLKGLNIAKNNDEICFSYTPHDRGRVHNANLLGAAFLARLYSITHENEFITPAVSAVRFSIRRQHEDGSWPYGDDKTQQWIDNFHTGFNLMALKKFSEYSGNSDYAENINKGFRFYKEHLFTDDGLPKYYHNQLYPIDIHAIAQSIITLAEFKEFDRGNMDLAKRIFAWSVKVMQSKEGYFFYQKKRFFKNRISYMRWSQAWMLLALSTLQKHCSHDSIGMKVSG